MKANNASSYNTPIPEVKWLVNGLIASDARASIVGKPKAAKSSHRRNLAAATITNRQFANRSVEVPEGQGRTVCPHLERKDKPHQGSEGSNHEELWIYEKY